jgi:hypothetical protein
MLLILVLLISWRRRVLFLGLPSLGLLVLGSLGLILVVWLLKSGLDESEVACGFRSSFIIPGSPLFPCHVR